MWIEIEKDNGTVEHIECESYTVTEDGRWLIVIDMCGNMLAYELAEDATITNENNKTGLKPC